MRCFVPNPPEEYLALMYGDDWGTPKKAWRYWRDCQAIDRTLVREVVDVFIFDTWDAMDDKTAGFLNRIRRVGNRLTVGVLADEAVKSLGEEVKNPYKKRASWVGGLPHVNRVIRVNSPSFGRDLQKVNYLPDYYIAYPGDCEQSLEYLRTFGCEVLSLDEVAKKTVVVSRRTARKVKVAVGIKTFMREYNLFRTIQAIREKFPYPYTLYIADDSDVTDEKSRVYAELEAEGHKIIRLPFNSGISAGRNAIIREATEDYVLIMDDDIDIGSPETIRNMKAVLDSAPDIGVVAGVLRHEISDKAFGNENYSKGIDFTLEEGVLCRETGRREVKQVDGIRYRESDQVVNFFLAKREVFNDVRWDNNIKVEWEHMDFFIGLKKTPWKAVICLDAHAVHLHSIDDYDYAYYRRRAPADYFCKKHGLGVRRGAPMIINRWATERTQCQIGR